MSVFVASSRHSSAMEGIEGVIFDFGGTLDSRGDHWYHVMNRAYLQSDLSLSREAYVYGERNIAPLVTPTDTMFDFLVKKVALQASHMGIDASGVAGRCYESARECVGESALTLGVLASRGYPMAVVSNFYGNLDAVLRDYGIRQYFAGVVDSGVVGVRKPDPAIFRLGLDLLGLPSGRVLVVGDSIDKDILPASSLGCPTLLIEGGKPWSESPRCRLPEGCIAVRGIEELVGVIS